MENNNEPVAVSQESSANKSLSNTLVNKKNNRP
jgi:hypothetical protein